MIHEFKCKQCNSTTEIIGPASFKDKTFVCENCNSSMVRIEIPKPSCGKRSHAWKMGRPS